MSTTSHCGKGLHLTPEGYFEPQAQSKAAVRRAKHDLGRSAAPSGSSSAHFAIRIKIREMRARQLKPSPAHIARYAEMGIKTILNLRGPSSTGYYWLEKEACETHGLAMINARMHSREPRAKIRSCAEEILRSIEYPP